MTARSPSSTTSTRTRSWPRTSRAPPPHHRRHRQQRPPGQHPAHGPGPDQGQQALRLLRLPGPTPRLRRHEQLLVLAPGGLLRRASHRRPRPARGHDRADPRTGAGQKRAVESPPRPSAQLGSSWMIRASGGQDGWKSGRTKLRKRRSAVAGQADALAPTTSDRRGRGRCGVRDRGGERLAELPQGVLLARRSGHDPELPPGGRLGGPRLPHGARGASRASGAGRPEEAKAYRVC